MGKNVQYISHRVESFVVRILLLFESIFRRFLEARVRLLHII